MRFNTNDSVSWFLDPTPLDHSEYDLVQTIVGDLDPAMRNEAYSGSPPAQLEVGFAGVRSRTSATMDLFSVIVHELGHAVGLGTTSIGAAAEDGDFDVPIDLIGGAMAGIRVSTDDDIAHLAAPRSAMFPVIVPDIRRLPSATDILAIASAAGWTELDLPRKDFLSDGRWQDASRWIGNQVPDADDLVTVRTGREIELDGTSFANSLSILVKDICRKCLDQNHIIQEIIQVTFVHITKGKGCRFGHIFELRLCRLAGTAPSCRERHQTNLIGIYKIHQLVRRSQLCKFHFQQGVSRLLRIK